MLNIIIVFKNISNCQFLLPVQHTFIEDKVIQVGIATIECFDGLTFFKSCNDKRCVVDVKLLWHASFSFLAPT